MKKYHKLHCGACMEDIDDIKELSKHISSCPAAKYMLPLIYQVWGGNDKTGHPLAHFIRNINNNASLIKQYAYSIVDEPDCFYRTRIHSKLCEKLGLDYNKFRPFESPDIKEIPSKKEAEDILWSALFDHGIKLINKGYEVKEK